jgi:hypothetical protein
LSLAQIFRLIHRVNTKQTSEQLFEAVKEDGITEEDFKAYLIYCSGQLHSGSPDFSWYSLQKW